MVTSGLEWLRGLIGLTGGYELKRVVTRQGGYGGNRGLRLVMRSNGCVGIVTGGNEGLGGLGDILVFTGVYMWVG